MKELVELKYFVYTKFEGFGPRCHDGFVRS